MYNVIRTLLLNRPHTEEGDHIPSSFVPIALAGSLKKLHDILFQSEDRKEFDVHCYIKLLNASRLFRYAPELYSPITYDKYSEQFFHTSRISTVKPSDSRFQIKVFGELKRYNHVAEFEIRQVGTSNNIRIFEKKAKLYFDEQGTSKVPVNITLQFTGNQSQLINIGDTGLQFLVLADSSKFTATGNNKWLFSAEYPNEFNFEDLWSRLSNAPATAQFLKEYSGVSAGRDLAAIYGTHFSKVYRFAALLVIYLKALNQWTHR